MMRLQTRAKVTVALGSFLAAATIGGFFLSSRIYRATIHPIVEEMNSNSVRLLSSGFESWVDSNIDQVKRLTDFHAMPDLIAVTRFTAAAEAATWEAEKVFVNEKHLKGYGVDAGEIERIRKEVPIPFSKILSNGTWLFNSSRPGALPVLSAGINLGSSDGVPRVLVVDLKPDPVLIQLRGRSFSQSWIANPDAEILVHSDPMLMEERKTLPAELKAFPHRGELFQKEIRVEDRLVKVAAWATAGKKLIAGSQTPLDRVDEPVNLLSEKTLIYLVSLILLGFAFAHRISRGWSEVQPDSQPGFEAVLKQHAARIAESDKSERAEMEVLREIISGWKRSFERDGWSGLEQDLKKPVTGYGSLLEEDLANLELIVQSHLRRMDERAEAERRVQQELK